ncbi:MAG: DUF1501 domain-containing protein [Planctomycetes bacterium]|nr:DUF1501 domain-containing protein [Planctomycetota bacterium]
MRPRDLVSRRRLLQAGGIGLLGLTLPRVLQAEAQPLTPGPSLARGEGRNRQKSCIFIVQYGGASHHDSWDLKPDAPDDIRGPYRPIATKVPGIQVGELFPKLASMADRYTIIRSMTHGNGGHDGGMHICMTGHSAPTVETPYYGSVVARLRPSTANLPSYVWLQNLAGDVQPRYLTGGFLGAAYSPLRVGTDMDNPAEPGFRFRAFDTAADVSHERMRQRLQLLQEAQGRATRVPGMHGIGANMQRFQERAVDLVTGPEARRAFDLSLESSNLRGRYGPHALGQNLLMARRLIEAGVRLVSVTAWAGLPRGERFRNVQTWDMHGEGAGLGSIFGHGAFGLGWALPNVDQAVSALLEDLELRGMLDDTLVVMVGEFGRSPRISRAGRDHWPACYSAMLAGAGIRGGYVHGSSDRQGGYVRDAAVRPEAFGATLFHALGIPPETRLSPDGFTRPASAGQPVLSLFA